MTNVTNILSQIEQGDPSAAEQLLPIVYDELRKLAASRLRDEKPGQTLQATALVHEAYIRLVDVENAQHWDSRGHFFAAAAEAMRRILVDQARRKGRLKRGANFVRHDLESVDVEQTVESADILSIDEALTKLAVTNEVAARLVNLRYFAGLTVSDAAKALGISPRKANQVWTYAQAWILAELGENAPSDDQTSI